MLIDAETGETVDVQYHEPEIFEKDLRDTIKPKGYHFYLNVDMLVGLKRVSSRTVADLVYLASMCNSVRRVAYKESHKPMSISKVRALIRDPNGLKLKELVACGLIYMLDDCVELSSNLISSGMIGVKNQTFKGFGSHIRVYSQYVRDYYENADNRQKNVLGMLYKLAPHINFEWNVITDDVNIHSLEEVSPSGAEKLCEYLGLSGGNAQRTLKGFGDISFTSGSGKFRLLLHGRKQGQYPGGYFINPLFMYRGKNIEEAFKIKIKTYDGRTIGYKYSQEERS